MHLNMSSPGWMSRVATAHLPTMSLVATVKGRQRPSSSCSAWCWAEQKLNKVHGTLHWGSVCKSFDDWMLH